MVVCSLHHSGRGKAVSITYSERVSAALVTQHAKCVRHIIFLSVACLALPCVSILSHIWYDFRKKKECLDIKLGVLTSLQLLSDIFLI
jgi:hypothetical protein